MIHAPDFPGKKVCVLGLGISGEASAFFLAAKGFEVWVSDAGASRPVLERLAKLRAVGIQGEAGTHSYDRIFGSDWAVISPGIPPFAPVMQEGRKRGLPIFSEIEVASRFFDARRVLAVTGTCGKTTLTTLLARMLNAGGYPAIACGNIGNPWIGELDTLGARGIAVLELSSFQLEHCYRLKPAIGILLNISPNHEDWHEDNAAYVRAKLRLFQAQTAGDHALIRRIDQQALFPGYRFNGAVSYFGADPDANPQAEVLAQTASILGLPAQAAAQTLQQFEGIEHRLEVFLKEDGIAYVNDSKSTTTAALIWALKKYPDRSVVLIAGGHPKSRDFDQAREWVARKVRLAVLVGEARELLREAWQGTCPLYESSDFQDAVRAARAAAQSGDTVLLSPACASFDMFKNYEERGRIFKTLIRGASSKPSSTHV